MPTKHEQIAAAIHEQLNDATVAMGVGQLALARYDQQRRIVWIPIASTVEPTTNLGGKLQPGATENRNVQAYTRHERIQAHIYAETAELVETLFSNVLAAISLSLKQGVNLPFQYDWVTEQREQAGENLWQAKILLTFTVRYPVLNEITPLTVATTQDHVGKFGAEIVC